MTRRTRGGKARRVLELCGKSAVVLLSAVFVIGVVRFIWPSAPSAAELRKLPDVVAVGHARAVGARVGKYGGWYRHEIELLDGRRAKYEGRRLLRPRACLEVHAKEWKGRLIVINVVELEEACDADDLRSLTR